MMQNYGTGEANVKTANDFVLLIQSLSSQEAIEVIPVEVVVASIELTVGRLEDIMSACGGPLPDTTSAQISAMLGLAELFRSVKPFCQVMKWEAKSDDQSM